MSSNTQPSITQLFTSFVRLGATAFGGPAMVAYIRTAVVEQKHWMDGKAFGDGVALCQVIPGATAMQMAAYVGLKTRGLLGAGVSIIAFGLAAFILMMTFAVLYAQTHNLPTVAAAFSGLQAVIVAIIANATVAFGRTTLKGWKTWALAGLAAMLFGFKLNPILVILLAAAAGAAVIRPSHDDAGHSIASAAVQSYKKPLLLILSGGALGLLLLFLFNRVLFDLVLLMIKISLLSFGGAFAALPIMLNGVVEVHHWMDNQTFMNAIVLGQVTPGPIVMASTFIGYLVGGLLGAVAATIGIFLPAFALVVGVSPYFERLRTSPVFNRALVGVLCSFVGLLLTVTIQFGLNVHWDLLHLLLGGGALAALLLQVDILWVVAAGTIISVLAIT